MYKLFNITYPYYWIIKFTQFKTWSK